MLGHGAIRNARLHSLMTLLLQFIWEARAGVMSFATGSLPAVPLEAMIELRR